HANPPFLNVVILANECCVLSRGWRHHGAGQEAKIRPQEPMVGRSPEFSRHSSMLLFYGIWLGVRTSKRPTARRSGGMPLGLTLVLGWAMSPIASLAARDSGSAGPSTRGYLQRGDSSLLFVDGYRQYRLHLPRRCY